MKISRWVKPRVIDTHPVVDRLRFLVRIGTDRGLRFDRLADIARVRAVFEAPPRFIHCRQ